MPSFRDIPETLRPQARPERDEPPHPQPEHLPAQQAVVDCGIYVDGGRLPGTFTHAEARAKVGELQVAGQEAFAWIGLHAPTEHQMQEVGDAFSMHPLAIEDAVCAHQRPKLERYDESLFLVLKTLNYVPHESTLLAREIVETGEVMVFVTCDFVVTVRHGDHGRLSDVRKRMDSDPEHMRQRRPIAEGRPGGRHHDIVRSGRDGHHREIGGECGQVDHGRSSKRGRYCTGCCGV